MLNPPREVTRCILDLLPAPSLARLTGMCSELLYADMVRVPASQAPEHSVSRIVDVLLRRAATRDRVDESRVGYSLASRLALREWRLCEHVRDATGVHRARHPVDGEKDQHSRAGHPTLNSAFATTFTMAPACSVSAAWSREPRVCAAAACTCSSGSASEPMMARACNLSAAWSS